MANYLINSPSSESVGTNTSDLFSLSKINGVTTFGLGGNDTITANGDALAAGSAAKLNAGAGADRIILSGDTVLSSSVVYAGQGKDFITTDRALYATNIRGGAGLDTIALSAAFLSAATVNGNDMADVITAGIAAESNESLIAAGMGSDVLSAVFVSGSNAVSINGGAGHDSISIVLTNAGGLSAAVINGGNGYDSISFDALASNGISGAGIKIDGGDLGDTISFAGEVVCVGTSTIAGGAGADTITFADNLAMSGGFVNGGLGNDSIYISAQFSAGSINGGAGADSITLGSFATGVNNAGTIYGDAGADLFSLGSASFAGQSGQTNVNTGNGVGIGYNAFSESTLSTFDSVSAGLTITTGTEASGVTFTSTLFNIRQDVLTAIAATNVAVANFTGTDGVATFTSTFSTNLTARVEELDRVLVVGQTIGFTDDQSKYYVFVQGGAAGSGTGDDLLVKLNTAVGSINVSANSSISVNTKQTV